MKSNKKHLDHKFPSKVQFSHSGWLQCEKCNIEMWYYNNTVIYYNGIESINPISCDEYIIKQIIE
jgi:hypothetical protein